MSEGPLERFRRERERGNEAVLRHAGKQMKRLYHIDGEVYKEGELSSKTKELLGLVGSLVLRCDDCISWHTLRCHEEGVSSAELEEAVAVAYTVGGSITVPHMRRLFLQWEELQK
jgi:AhpD family alkylhydroperoxidase